MPAGLASTQPLLLRNANAGIQGARLELRTFVESRLLACSESRNGVRRLFLKDFGLWELCPRENNSTFSSLEYLSRPEGSCFHRFRLIPVATSMNENRRVLRPAASEWLASEATREHVSRSASPGGATHLREGGRTL